MKSLETCNEKIHSRSAACCTCPASAFHGEWQMTASELEFDRLVLADSRPSHFDSLLSVAFRQADELSHRSGDETQRSDEEKENVARSSSHGVTVRYVMASASCRHRKLFFTATEERSPSDVLWS
jgi:hypothetical protein